MWESAFVTGLDGRHGLFFEVDLRVEKPIAQPRHRLLLQCFLRKRLRFGGLAQFVDRVDFLT